MKEKAIRALINIQIRLRNKVAAVNTVELIILLLATVTISFCVVIAIKKIMGDGENEEGSGVLNSFKNTFENRQN